jgi:hypothetical protein
MSKRVKPKRFPRPFTLVIDGVPVLTFLAVNAREALSLRNEEWLQADLREARSNGMPLWDGQTSLSVRGATDAEAARFSEGIVAGAALSEELLLVYLVPLDG